MRLSSHPTSATFDQNDLMLKYGELENNVATYLTTGVLLNRGQHGIARRRSGWFQYVMAGDFKILQHQQSDCGGS